MRTLRFAAVAALAACALFVLSCHKNEEYSQHFNKASDEHFKRDMGDPHWERTVDGLKLTPVLLSSFVLRRLVHDAQHGPGGARGRA